VGIQDICRHEEENCALTLCNHKNNVNSVIHIWSVDIRRSIINQSTDKRFAIQILCWGAGQQWTYILDN